MKCCGDSSDRGTDVGAILEMRTKGICDHVAPRVHGDNLGRVEPRRCWWDLDRRSSVVQIRPQRGVHFPEKGQLFQTSGAFVVAHIFVVHVHTNSYMCIRECMYIRLSTYICICIHTYMYVCMCIHAILCKCVHVFAQLCRRSRRRNL